MKGAELRRIQACIFDLDGVIVDTARLHYQAWKELADDLGISFSEKDNERLKGISRMESLEILLQIGGMSVSRVEMAELVDQKNRSYVNFVKKMTENDVLPGVRDFVQELQSHGIRVSVASASKNAQLVLRQVGLINAFDAVSDGRMVKRAKPDPEIFLHSSAQLKIPVSNCLVFEDATAGIEAAHRAGMVTVGVGNRKSLKNADTTIPGFAGLTIPKLCSKVYRNGTIEIEFGKEDDNAKKAKIL